MAGFSQIHKTNRRIYYNDSGPGLAAAQQLNFAGHLVEVYERFIEEDYLGMVSLILNLKKCRK